MFNGIWLVAAEPLTINGRDVPAGERFEISRHESGALLVMRRAMIAESQKAPVRTPDAPTPRRRGRSRKTVTPETPTENTEPAEPAETPAATDGSESPRSYRRRDLEAEP